MNFRLLPALASLILCANAAPAELELKMERLRNSKGLVHICLTRQAAHFPGCEADPQAVRRTIAAGAGPVRFSDLAPGSYAIAVLHDENGNRRLDSLLRIPREGFGFSRNPVVRFGAPRFQQVIINIAPGFNSQTVRMQYLL